MESERELSVILRRQRNRRSFDTDGCSEIRCDMLVAGKPTDKYFIPSRTVTFFHFYTRQTDTTFLRALRYSRGIFPWTHESFIISRERLKISELRVPVKINVDTTGYRYVGSNVIPWPATTFLSLGDLFRERRTVRSMGTEKMRSMRQEGRKVDTVERGCSRVGAFRECRRLRLMVFTESPGYRAFL